jgi:hypothetical protein
MEVSWCSIKEYRRIATWAKEISVRRIRQLIQANIFPEEVRRIPAGKAGAKYTYQIRLSKPEEVDKLSHTRYFETIAQKDDVATNTKVQILNATDSHPPTSFRLDMAAPIGSFIDIALQNKIIKQKYNEYLSNCGASNTDVAGDHSTKGRLKNRHIVRCNINMKNALCEYAKHTGLTMKEAYVVLLMKYLNSPAGKIALCTAQTINNKHNIKKTEKEDIKYGHAVC